MDIKPVRPIRLTVTSYSA